MLVLTLRCFRLGVCLCKGCGEGIGHAWGDEAYVMKPLCRSPEGFSSYAGEVEGSISSGIHIFHLLNVSQKLMLTLRHFIRPDNIS